MNVTIGDIQQKVVDIQYIRERKHIPGLGKVNINRWFCSTGDVFALFIGLFKQ